MEYYKIGYHKIGKDRTGLDLGTCTVHGTSSGFNMIGGERRIFLTPIFPFVFSLEGEWCQHAV